MTGPDGGDAFYEWLLSDHPGARAEREARREGAYRDATRNAAAVRAWTAKINADPGAPQSLQDLAATVGPVADRRLARAEAARAVPDEAYVARARAEHENHMRAAEHGTPDYTYPARLTGPDAASAPRPPEPGAAAETGTEAQAGQ